MKLFRKKNVLSFFKESFSDRLTVSKLFYIFISFSKTTSSTKLGTKHPSIKGILNKVRCPFQSLEHGQIVEISRKYVEDLINVLPLNHLPRPVFNKIYHKEFFIKRN